MKRAVIIEPVKNLDVESKLSGREVTYLWRSYSDHPHPFDPEFQAALTARLGAVGFDPWDDCLVIAGSLVLVSMTAAMLGREYGWFSALVFDPREHKRAYEEILFGVTNAGAKT